MPKLDPPFPSSPHRPPKFTFQFFRSDKRVSIQGFSAAYAARKFINTVLGDSEYKWRDDDTLHAEDIMVTIKGEGLEDVMEYKMKGAETEWLLPEPQATEAKFIGTGERVRHTRESVRAKKEADGEEVSDDDNKPSRAKGNRAPPRREVPDGMIGLAAICEEIGMEPRDARAILRKKADKPEHGWAWSSADAKGIKAMLSGKDHAGDKAPLPSKGAKDDETNGEAAQGRKAKSSTATKRKSKR